MVSRKLCFCFPPSPIIDSQMGGDMNGHSQESLGELLLVGADKTDLDKRMVQFRRRQIHVYKGRV